jgi:hypothetical protein
MQVVNVRDYRGLEREQVIYVGRNPEKYGFPRALAIGGHHGNHYVVGVHGAQGECVKLYRRWLWERMQAHDRSVTDALFSLEEGDLIGCWCHPKPCHADVIVAAAKWLQANPF